MVVIKTNWFNIGANVKTGIFNYYICTVSERIDFYAVLLLYTRVQTIFGGRGFKQTLNFLFCFLLHFIQLPKKPYTPHFSRGRTAVSGTINRAIQSSKK